MPFLALRAPKTDGNSESEHYVAQKIWNASPDFRVSHFLRIKARFVPREALLAEAPLNPSETLVGGEPRTVEPAGADEESEFAFSGKPGDPSSSPPVQRESGEFTPVGIGARSGQEAKSSLNKVLHEELAEGGLRQREKYC